MRTEGAANDSPDSGVYIFDRDWAASARLSYQHSVIKLREGWLLHPTIKDAITPQLHTTTTTLRIADVAAGNCIWSTDILAELSDSNVEVTALDISPQLFPPELARSPNLTVDTWNIFDPVPDKYKSFFDVVHIRLVISVLHKGGIETVVANLVSMLKPGGWIQWQDAPSPAYNYIDPQTLQRPPEAEWPEITRILADLIGFRKGSGWVLKLDELFRDIGGCVDVELLEVPYKRETLRYESEAVPWVFGEMLNGPMKGMAERDEVVREKVERMRREVEKETRLIVGGERFWAYSLFVAVGGKPL